MLDIKPELHGIPIDVKKTKTVKIARNTSGKVGISLKGNRLQQVTVPLLRQLNNRGLQMP
jgi:hypothetical protein